MRWTFRIARVAGTDVKIHLTFFLLGIYVLQAYRQGGGDAAARQAAFILLLFLCILLHEFGHILMARRFGVQTPDVILLPIGGVARLQRLPEEPKQELLIALAGPAVTLAIAALLYVVTSAGGQPPGAIDLDPSETGSWWWLVGALMWVNVYLLLFNLIPAFPMDGGRVLRAILAHRMGLPRATRIAAAVGQFVALGFGVLGLMGNPLLVLIAFFVFLGAGSEAAAVETRTMGRGVRVGDMMVTAFRSIPIHATLQHAVQLLLAGEQREFPVVDNAGRVEGILTRENLIKGLTERGVGSVVGEWMTPEVPLVRAEIGFEEALEQLRSSGLRALPVVDRAGTLVGLLTMDNVTDLLLVRRAIDR